MFFGVSSEIGKKSGNSHQSKNIPQNFSWHKRKNIYICNTCCKTIVLIFIVVKQHLMPRKALFTKEEIVEKALDLVRRKGFEALTARELGTALGCSSRPIFTVFNSMEEVASAVKQAAQQLFSDYVADVNNYTPAFKEFGLRLVRFAHEEQTLFNLLVFHKDADVANEIHPKALECLDFIRSDYSITKEQAYRLFGQLWAFVCGLALLSSKDATLYSDEVVSDMISLQFASTLSFIKSGKNLVSPTPHLRAENETTPNIIEYLEKQQ